MSEIYRVKTFLQLYTAMMNYMVGKTSAITNFNPGSRIRTLLEAIALNEAEVQADFYKGLKDAIPTSVFEGFGFAKKSGIRASGKLTFKRITALGTPADVPAGTQVSLDDLTFETLEDGAIPASQQESPEILARCTTVGEAGNIGVTSIDTENGFGKFINQPPGVDFARNDTAFASGEDEETESDRLDRFTLYVASLSKSTIQGIISGALTVDGVKSASVREWYPSPGWITVYCDDGSGTLTPAVKTEVLKVLNGDINDPDNYPGYRAAGIMVDVIAPTIFNQNVTLKIKYLYTTTVLPADLITLATTAIQQYINSLKIGEDIIVSEIITAVQNCHPDIYDVEMTTPTANVTIASDIIARTGTVTVTAEETTI